MVHFEEPARLALALLALPMAWAGLRWFGSMSALRRATAILARTVLVVLLALLVAGTHTVRSTDKLAVIGVIDNSGSVRRFAPRPADGMAAGPEQAGGFLNAAFLDRGPDDLLGAVAFDNAAVAVASPSRGGLPAGLADPTTEGTDIAAALRLAAAMIPADAAGRLVLFSDGNQTAGDALEAAREIAGRAGGGRFGSAPIDVVPIRYEAASEVAVEAVDAPPTAAAESVLNVRVTLSSTMPVSGVIRLLREDEPVDLNGLAPGAGRRVELQPGRTVLVLPVQLPAGRVHRFKAIFEPDAVEAGGAAAADHVEENNTGEAFTITPGKGSVLLVDGVSDGDPAGAGSTLARALRESAIEVSVVSPAGFPKDLVDLQAFDLVVLENVPADAIEPASHEHLASFVKDLGGGLIMVGGPASFGAGGWRGTPVEPLLPVKLDLPERLMVPEIAIVFVLDQSGSMRRTVSGSSRTQQEIAGEATIAAIRSLDSHDLIGVVAFSKDPEVVWELAPNTDPAATISAVRGISPNGGTAIGPGLSEAARMLAASQAKLKHIVLLSDGRSLGEDELPALAAGIASQGIRISSIAMGNDASVGTMELIAQNGNGTFYNVLNPSTLPRVFLKIVRIVRSPMIRETPFEPVLAATGSPLVAGLDQPPPLGGLTLTQARLDPNVVNAMRTPDGEPVLAHWTVELGQVAAFTSDAHHWARAWVDWPGYRRFWSQAVRTLSRAGGDRLFQAETRVEAGELRVRLNAADDAGRPIDQLDVPATIYSPSGSKRDIQLAQTGPGVYEAALSAPEAGSYIAVIKPRSKSARLTPVISGAAAAASPEFQRLSSNVALLEQIAAATGGRVLDPNAPAAARLFDRKSVTPRRALTPLWKPLLMWTLVVLLLDIGTRRIAWDRWISPRLGSDLQQAAAEAIRERGGQAQRTLAGLRERRDRHEPAVPALALDERHARELARAAADRRRAQRLAEVRRAAEAEASSASQGSPAPSGSPGAESAGADASDGGLLAAKRRARERFEDQP